MMQIRVMRMTRVMPTSIGQAAAIVKAWARRSAILILARFERGGEGEPIRKGGGKRRRWPEAASPPDRHDPRRARRGGRGRRWMRHGAGDAAHGGHGQDAGGSGSLRS